MAAIVFDEDVVIATTKKALSIHRDLPAGTLLKLEVGTDELSVAVPSGKVWDAQITMCIHETDA